MIRKTISWIWPVLLILAALLVLGAAAGFWQGAMYDSVLLFFCALILIGSLFDWCRDRIESGSRSKFAHWVEFVRHCLTNEPGVESTTHQLRDRLEKVEKRRKETESKLQGEILKLVDRHNEDMQRIFGINEKLAGQRDHYKKLYEDLRLNKLEELKKEYHEAVEKIPEEELPDWVIDELKQMSTTEALGKQEHVALKRVIAYLGRTLPPDKIEKTRFNVVLSSTGTDKIKVIKTIREMTGFDLKTAKELTDSVPVVLNPVSLSKEDAEKFKSRLEDSGAGVEIT